MKARVHISISLGTLLSAFSIHAAVVAYDSPTPAVYQSEGGYPPEWGAFNFQQFDPSLGMLNSVSIQLDGQITEYYVITGGNDSQGVSTLTLTMGVQDQANDLDSSIAMTFNSPYSLQDPNDRAGGVAVGEASAETTYFAPVVLDEFTGTGTIVLPGYSTFVIQESPANAVSEAEDPFYALYGSVTYDYTAVPEPIGTTIIAAILPVIALGTAGIRGRVMERVRP